jgi:hypothetical protein
MMACTEIYKMFGKPNGPISIHLDVIILKLQLLEQMAFLDGNR